MFPFCNIVGNCGINLVAKNFLKETKDIGYISKVTGKTAEEIRKLQKN